MFCSAGQCVCVGVCVYAHARVWKGRGSAYRAWLKFNSLTASGKKLFLSLVVLLRMLLSRLPEGRSWKSLCDLI